MNINFSVTYPLLKGTGKTDSGRDIMILSETVVVHVDKDVIVIPKDFLFDGESIPRIFWWLFNPLEQDCIVAALLHDWLYRTEYFPRSICDNIFLHALISLNKSKFEAYLKYGFVRVGGNWCKHTLKSIVGNRALSGNYSIARPFKDNLNV